jgi:hypothetical protein
MCVVSTKLHNRESFFKNWVWLDAERDVDLSIDTSINLHATWPFQHNKLCGGCEGGKGGGRGRQM